MKRFCFYLFCLLVTLTAAPVEIWGASQDDPSGQCPQADKYRLQRSFYFSNLKEVVRAPSSPQEVEARFAELTSGEQWRRQAAISSLALAGNLDLFEQLLVEGDGDGMLAYASNYLREDGNLCLDPQIEEALVRNYHDSRFTQAFLAFFHKNLYSSQAFFKTLTPLDFDANNPEQYGLVVKALCATRLAGLDEPLLAIGKAALPHDTPVQKRLMPGVHQSLIGYFANQQSAVLSYFRAVLAAEPRSEEVVYFQNSYGQTRLAIYEALAQYDSQESFAIFLEQLAELALEPWGPYYTNDLQQLSSNLKRHNLFAEEKEKVVPLLAEILATPSLPGQAGFTPPRERAGEPGLYDQKIRKQVYALLAEIDSVAAASLLVDELSRLHQRPVSDGRPILSAALLQGLASLSPSTAVDVERLIAFGGQGVAQIDILPLAEILARHPHPAGFRFVLDRFVRSFEEKGDRAMILAAHGHVAAQLFDFLLHFSGPEYLRQTRQQIDDLFLAEKLPEDRYRKMSIAVAQRLGEDSPTYLSLLQAKKDEKAEKRRQELAAAQAKWRQEMIDELDRQGSQAGIAANIKALSQFGAEAKKAAYWLIRIGLPILPQAHEALVEPAATSELKMQLMVVLGEIGDQSSMAPIIAAVKTEPANTMLVKDAFLSLARIPPAEEAIAFAQEWLEDDTTSQRQKMSALAYFASHRHRQALSWYRKFSNQDTSPPLRATALYLGAMLAEKELKGQIVEMLVNSQDRKIDYLLWRALAEITSPEEFSQVVGQKKAEETWELKQIDQYVRFRHSEGAEKVELAEELLAAKTPFYSATAIGFLLANKDFATLAKFFEKKEPYLMSLEMKLYMSAVAQRIFSEARRQGYRLEEKEDGIHFLPQN